MRRGLSITFSLSLICCLLFLCTSCSEEIPEFKNNWDEDVYFFARNLEDNHADLFHEVSKSEFDRDIQTLRDSTVVFSEKRILLELGKIIGKIGDSHTQLQYLTRLDVFPFEVTYFDDGIYLTKVQAGFENALGRKVVEIYGIPIDEVLELFREYIPYENESNFKNQVVQYIPFGTFYPYHHGFEDIDLLEVEVENLLHLVLPKGSGDLIDLSTAQTPLFLEDTETFYWHRIIPEDNLLFIQYNSCQERSDLPFESFTDNIDEDIQNNPDIDKLVIDLRHNGGGNSSIMRPLIDQLESYISEDRFSKEEIYLIIGRRTFSSALLNTLEIKDKIDPVIIGEPSGGKPDHFGEIKTFLLPNSKLKVYYSTKYFENASTDEDSVYPDLEIPYTSQDFIMGEDPVLEEITK